MGTANHDPDGNTAWVRHTLIALVVVFGLVVLIAVPFIVAAAITSVSRQGAIGGNK